MHSAYEKSTRLEPRNSGSALFRSRSDRKMLESGCVAPHRRFPRLREEKRSFDAAIFGWGGEIEERLRVLAADSLPALRTS